jgi:sugar/nucleoside kinase (ribokinase family)
VSITGDNGKQQTCIQFFKLAITKFRTERILHPIGAGDAVAAGTLAAWVSLVRHEYRFMLTPSSSSAIPIVLPECLDLLIQRANDLCYDSRLAEDVAKQAVAAFAFSLICGGSAS